MAMNNAYLSSKSDSQSDECYTPRYAVKPLVKYLRANKYHTILCPFSEEHSKYVEVLKEEGFTVYHSHLVEGKDFFTYTREELDSLGIDCIVDNPPFSIKTKVLAYLYDLGKPFIMLFPQNTLQGKARTKLFIKNGIEYLGFDSRICFYTNNELDAIKTSNHFASGYFCWKVLGKEMVLEELVLVNEPYFRNSNGVVKAGDRFPNDNLFS